VKLPTGSLPHDSDTRQVPLSCGRRRSLVFPIPMHSVPPPDVRRRVVIPPNALRTTIPDLCRRAGILVQASSDRPIVIVAGPRRRSVRTPTVDVVAVPCAPRSAEGALRALEILAHGFHDPCARHCVCGRGYFSPMTGVQ
jgi:hypothetical protein